MFAIRRNVPYKVFRATAFERKDKTTGAVIILRERDNQPEGVDKPSKSNSSVKIWLDKLPKGIKNGSYISLGEFDVDWRHVPSTFKEGAFDDVLELVNCKFKVCKMETE